MRKLWMLTLGLAALAAAEGCKRNAPEPIPGPKAVPAVVGHTSAAGIAWFQGSLDEAFARPGAHVTCAEVRAPMAPLGADLSRPPIRNRLNTPPPAACRSGTCPSTAAAPRRPLV
jgi:hypothetical protein